MDTSTRYTTSDQQLWNAVRAGDKQAFSELYQRYFNVLYDYGIKLIGEEAGTRDCIQDLFIYLWNRRGRLSAANSVRFYLYTSFRRRLFKYLEKKRSRENGKQDFDLFQPDIDFSVETRIIAEEEEMIQVELVEKLMHELSPRQKEVLYLRFYGELSPKEIAKVMSLNYQTVINHFYEGIKTLRKQKPTIIKTMLGAIAALLMMARSGI